VTTIRDKLSTLSASNNLKTMESRFLYGKYKGAYVSAIIAEDPQYVQWCKDSVDRFELNDDLESLLQESLNHSALVAHRRFETYKRCRL
jgi:hypothetical protein